MNAMNKRTTVLAAIVVFGTLSIVVSARQAMPKGPTTASLNATNIEKVRENLYVITGSKTLPESGGVLGSIGSPTRRKTLSTPLSTAYPYTPTPARNSAVPSWSRMRARRRMGLITNW